MDVCAGIENGRDKRASIEPAAEAACGDDGLDVTPMARPALMLSRDGGNREEPNFNSLELDRECPLLMPESEC
jgi:hypothetical protein